MNLYNLNAAQSSLPTRWSGSDRVRVERMKKLKFVRKNDRMHWVGDGFPVRSIFTYQDIAPEVSPFLLLDYAGPTRFEPTTARRGVGAHPHRGFETVTVVYSGEVEHRDSTGAGGTIGPGEVQWMTAASGLVHEEYHGKNFARTGGPFEMVQLWVNLPSHLKMSEPGYQSLTRDMIPEIACAEGAGRVRLIAGNYGDHRGPALTRTPINLWDIRLDRACSFACPVPEGHTASLLVLSGSIRLQEGQVIQHAELAVLEPENGSLGFEATADTKVLFLGGEPLDEPIVGAGPFVMNTIGEIRQAFSDFQNGKMGRFDD